MHHSILAIDTSVTDNITYSTIIQQLLKSRDFTILLSWPNQYTERTPRTVKEIIVPQDLSYSEDIKKFLSNWKNITLYFITTENLLKVDRYIIPKAYTIHSIREEDNISSALNVVKKNNLNIYYNVCNKFIIIKYFITVSKYNVNLLLTVNKDFLNGFNDASYNSFTIQCGKLYCCKKHCKTSYNTKWY